MVKGKPYRLKVDRFGSLRATYGKTFVKKFLSWNEEDIMVPSTSLAIYLFSDSLTFSRKRSGLIHFRSTYGSLQFVTPRYFEMACFRTVLPEFSLFNGLYFLFFVAATGNGFCTLFFYFCLLLAEEPAAKKRRKNFTLNHFNFAASLLLWLAKAYIVITTTAHAITPMRAISNSYM